MLVHAERVIFGNELSSGRYKNDFPRDLRLVVLCNLSDPLVEFFDITVLY